ncbi:MAG: hypothetical protein A4E64_01077 [Syntrophorhabdus sp. PtaU1.Bin058]|nr:MAG: hypothetical protein A4E64_01077 [Syntrophorhabdus sp. PtaU1.Bin058]
MKTKKIVKPVFVGMVAVFLFVSAVASQNAAGTTKTLRFVEGQIKTSNGTNHSHVTTDLVGGIITGISTQLLNQLMDSLSSAPSAPSTGTTTGVTVNQPPSASNILITTDPNTGVITMTPVETQQNSVVLNVSPGQVYSTGSSSQQSVSSAVIQSERDKIKNQYAVPYAGTEAPIGIGIGLDTFFVPPGKENSRFESNLEMTWSFTKEELDHYNSLLQLKQLLPGLVPIGAMKLKTAKSRYVREVGARADLGVDLKWKSTWHNNITSINITDLGMEINEEDRDKLGSSRVDHSDTMNVSDIPGLVIELAAKMSSTLGSKAGSAAAKGAGDSLAEKIFDKMKIGVLVTQTTRDRYVTVKLEMEAKDMTGQVMNNVSLDKDILTFNDEGVDHILHIRIPENCPPIKSIALRVKDAAYHYTESGTVELGVSASYIPIEVRTIKLTEGIGLYFPNEHNVKVRDEDRPSFTVTGGVLAYVPFHGIVVSNTDPASGIEGVKLDLIAKDRSFQKTEYTHPDGKFYGDFYVGNDTGIAPEAVITASKEGYPAGRYTTQFINNAEGYKISMHLSPDQLIVVTGRVLDTQGNPIAGAEVHATKGTNDVWVATASDGRFYFKLLKEGATTFSAFKGGYNIPVVTKTFAERETAASVDLQATSQMSPGAIKLVFQGPGKTSLSGLHIKRASGEEFNVGVGQDGMVKIPCQASETLTLSAQGLIFNPDRVIAQFAGSQPGQEKQFDITVSSSWANSVSIAPAQATIETGGVSYNDGRQQERTQFTAIVKDMSGNPMNGIPVRFEVVSKTQTAAIKFSREGGKPGCGYGTTDSQGRATVDAVAYNTLGTLTIKAVALDKYLVTGNTGDELSSPNTVQITIVPTTRVSQPAKPTATVQVYTNSKAVLGVATPTVEKGGEFVFHLAQSLGNAAVSPLNPSGQITAYTIGFSKDNGSWQEETHETAPPLSIPKTFNEKGNYKVGYKVRETYAGQQIWSDRVEAPFNVVEFTPPQVSLTVPNTTGTVNLPLSYSFSVTASAPLQGITLTFGDNDMDIVLDPGLLSGRTSWSGSFHHVYKNTGSYTMHLTAVDQNSRSAETTKNITVQSVAALNDTVAPTGSVSINNGAAATNVRGVMLRITGQDNSGGSGIYRFRVSNDGTNWSIWNSINFADDVPQPGISKDYTWQLSEGAGTKTVYVQLKDASENVSNVLTATIQLQAAGLQVTGSLPPPTVTDTFYNNAPAPHGSISITGRQGNNISATFSATNDWAIGINQMALSFDNTNWTGWMQFETNKQIDLAGHLDATKLYVTYGDRAGGKSPVYSADIPAASQVQTAQTQTSQVQTSQPAGQQGAQQGQAQTGAPSGSSSGAQTQAASSSGGQAQAPGSIAGTSQKPAQDKERLSVAISKAEVKQEQVDLSIDDIRVAQNISLGQSTEIEVSIRNNSNVEIKDCRITFSGEDGTTKNEKVSLGPRARERMKFEWTPRKEGRQKISVALDYKEDTNRINNKADETVDVKGKETANITLVDVKLPQTFVMGQKYSIEAVVKNDSTTEARGCSANFEAEDGSIDRQRVDLRSRASENVRFTWAPRREGRYRINVTIECKADENAKDNTLSRNVEVKPAEDKKMMKKSKMPGER